MVPEDTQVFAQGMTLKDGTTYRPGKLEIISSGEFSEIYVTISEGKFHQVKRMLEYIDNEVVLLKRIKIGNLSLPSDLEEGKYKEISLNDVF